MPKTYIEAKYIALLDEIESTLHDPEGASRLAGHLQDLPDLIQGLQQSPQEREQIEIVVDRSGRVVSQNAASATRLGLCAGDHLAEISLSSKSLFGVDDRKAIPILVVDLTGGATFLFGHAVDSDGTFLLTEVQLGVDGPILQTLARSFGLIPSESQLLRGLMQGKSVQTVADDLGRSEGTARQQLKSIMAKIGVNSQQQLIATLYAMSLMHQRAGRSPSLMHTLDKGAKLHKGRHGTVGLHMFGPESGMPVLFLHGALFGIAALPALREAAQTLGLRIIAPERPGYGNTAFLAGENPVSLATLQAVDLLDALGLPQVVVLAHDVGTRFAARLAVAAPHRVAAVVAAPTTPPMQTWAQTADMPTRHRLNAWAAQHLPALMDKIVTLGLAQISRHGVQIIPRLVFDGCDFDQAILRQPNVEAVLQEAFQLAWAQRGVGLRADMHITNENWQEDAKRITTTFLCLHGANSCTVSRAAVEMLAEKMPRGHFKLVENAGHSLPISHPALILRAVLAAGRAAGLGGDEFGFLSAGN